MSVVTPPSPAAARWFHRPCALFVPADASNRLYRLNLGTGSARQLGVVSRAPNLVAFAALSKQKR